MAFNRAWGNFIPDGKINGVIADWQGKQPERVQVIASPSSLLDCPRVVWLRKQGVPPVNELGWGQKQRFMLGRITENTIAKQLKDQGLLLHHWKDDTAGESEPLAMGAGDEQMAGTPDLLLTLGDQVAISDSKTSRSDSFNYVPIEPAEIWEDPYWFKYKLQLTAYYLLCHANPDWFAKRELPLPKVCHLFSYALDDGIVRRELIWEPTEVDIESVKRLAKRWNNAYNSPTMPECTCVDEGSVKFCPYGIKKEGARVCSECCDPQLGVK
jgi:hypothetical protein